jgi:protoheme ferro-lyase
VRAVTSTREGWRGPDVALVLAAHGTLVAPSKPIDTGLAATQAICDAIRDELKSEFGLVVNGWLNHTRGGKWTEPAMADALRQVSAAGFTRAVYFPYGFLADNAETQLEGRISLRDRPEIEAWHLPCLNADARLMGTLAGLVSSGAAGNLLRVAG